jgi:flagellar biosynthesis protein FlhG
MPIVIPVASGKGGVGKSFLAANIAIALAKAGHRVVAADLDLGAPNLHAFLGIRKRQAGIGDFLKARSVELPDLIAPTGIEHLGFISGDAKTPFMADITYQQKRRLISRLNHLPADYVVLDLSTGTAFHTLDFYRLSPFGLLVTVPDNPSLVNLINFLKLVLVRSIEKAFSGRPAIRRLLANEYVRPHHQQFSTISDLKTKISSLDPSAGEKTATLLAQIRPRVVFNRCRTPLEFHLSQKLDDTIAEKLSIAVDYFGFVFEDTDVNRSVDTGQAYLSMAQKGETAAAVRRIARRIETSWETPVPDSAEQIRKYLKALPTKKSNPFTEK